MNSLVAALLEPGAYDHPVAAVQLLETHISWIFLTGTYAYKVKKPVDLGFLNFSTLELRRHCCHEEVRLNRRLAGDLYLGVRAIHGPRAHLGGSGPVIETAVQMRQFHQHDLLPTALERGLVSAELMEGLAQDLARFHASAAQAPASDPWGSPVAVLEPALANLDTLVQLGRSPADLAALKRWTLEGLETLRPLLEARRGAGRIRECHGDLHLGNLVLHGGRILVFDCLEFSPPLRWIDPISDLAFLVMDLRQRGHGLLALRLLNRWLDQGGDHGSLPLLPWYLAYRALVRAKVTAIRLGEGAQATDQRRLEGDLERYLDQARQAMAPGPGALVITHGISGSGKSHAATQLRDRGWIHLRSDVERLRLFGRWGYATAAPPASASDQEAPYTAVVTGRVYTDVLLQAAGSALTAGLAVVVDATFLKQGHRQAFQDLAGRHGAGFAILACSAPLPLALERLEQRRQRGGDPSEADDAVVHRQIEILEPLTAEEQTWVVQLDDPRLEPPGKKLERAGAR